MVNRQECSTGLVDEKADHQRDGKANQHFDETEAIVRGSFSENARVGHLTITSFRSISINRLGIVDGPCLIGEDSGDSPGHERNKALVARLRLVFEFAERLLYNLGTCWFRNSKSTKVTVCLRCIS